VKGNLAARVHFISPSSAGACSKSPAKLCFIHAILFLYNIARTFSTTSECTVDVDGSYVQNYISIRSKHVLNMYVITR
jgi:hypothetical protein